MKIQPHITILICAVLFTVLSSTSCKDKNKSYCEENPGECSDIREVKDYFAFKQGSWWVYEEETSHERDSVYVTEYFSDPNSFGFDVRMHSTLEGYDYHYFPDYLAAVNGCSESGDIYKKCVLIKRTKGKPGDYVGESAALFYKFKIGQSETDPNNALPSNRIIIDYILDDYSLGNYNFKNVIKVKELCNYLEGKQKTFQFYTSGVGLIRTELIDSNQVWNLVNYHIQE